VAVDLQQREVARRVGADDLGGLRLVARPDLDLDLRGAVDHVVVGDDEAVLGDDEARARRLALRRVGDDVGDGVLGGVVDLARVEVGGDGASGGGGLGAHRGGWVVEEFMRDDGAPADGEGRCDATGEQALGDGHAARMRRAADQRLRRTEAPRKTLTRG
jgi:hypothetical protein